MTNFTADSKQRDHPDAILALLFNDVLRSIDCMSVKLDSMNDQLANLSVGLYVPAVASLSNVSAHAVPSSLQAPPSDGPFQLQGSLNMTATAESMAPAPPPSSPIIAPDVPSDADEAVATVNAAADEAVATVNPAGVIVGSAPNVPTPSEVDEQVALIPLTLNARWFVVTSGTVPGVYSSWEETSPLVTGVSRAVCTRCTSKEEALLAYRSAWEQGYVVRRPV